VVNRLVHILPHGKRQEAPLEVEGCGDRRRMLNGDVFGGKEPGETIKTLSRGDKGLDIGVDLLLHTVIII